MISKTKLKEQIKTLPENFSIDQLVEKLILIEKVEEAEKQSLNGETISEEDLDKEIDKWFE